ncbi:MAG: hypothetical protein H0W70_14100 [Actinobacteria bacterium]|nr:hypothetical protein [Actinomycetota bacterium]
MLETLVETLRGIVSRLDDVLADVDPSLLHPRDASKLLTEFEAIERRAAAGKMVVAARAADAGEWSRQGHRSPEDWLASASGTTYGQAAATLEASLKLGQLPALDAAVRNGELSSETRPDRAGGHRRERGAAVARGEDPGPEAAQVHGGQGEGGGAQRGSRSSAAPPHPQRALVPVLGR